MLTIDNELILMEKYKLTPDELFCIRLINLAAVEDEVSYLARFVNISESHRALFRHTLSVLQDKGVILKSYKIPNEGEQFIPQEVEFNKNFMKAISKASFELGEELFNEYPLFTIINNSAAPLRGIAKKFNSPEDFYRFYGKQIGWDPVKHSEILKLVKWGKANNVIKESIASFVINRGWETLCAMKNGNVANINYDAIIQL